MLGFSLQCCLGLGPGKAHHGLLLFGIQLYVEIYWINQRRAQLIPLACGLLASNVPSSFSSLLFSNTLWRVSQALGPDHLGSSRVPPLPCDGAPSQATSHLVLRLLVDSAPAPPGAATQRLCDAVWRCGWAGSGSLLRALVFVLITVAFLRRWQIAGYLARWTNLFPSFFLSFACLSHFNKQHPY